MQRSFSNGFQQKRPFVIYVVGPHGETCDLFYNTLKMQILSTKGLDVIGYDAPGAFTCTHKARKPDNSDVRYHVVSDSAPLDEKAVLRGIPRIDAFVLVFRIDQPVDFSTINTRHVDRIVRLSDQYISEPKTVFFIVAHHANKLSTVQAYTREEIAALVFRSHAVFRYGDLRDGPVCTSLMDMLIVELIASHSAHALPRSVPSAPELSPWQRAFAYAMDTIYIPECGGSGGTDDSMDLPTGILFPP